MVLTIASGHVSNSTPDLGRYATVLATGAGELIRGRSGLGTVSSKSTSTDLVTEVDRATEQWLLERIATDRPDDAVLGEEGADRSGRSGIRWVVDPVDGTVNFVLGLPSYAVSVAAERDGEVVAGAVCDVVSGAVYCATVGAGAWRDDQSGSHRLTGPRVVPLDRAVVGTGFNYDRGVRERQGQVAAQLLPRIADIRRIGSAALDLCALAAGRLDAYYEAGLNRWDAAAGALIATEAGCVVSGLRGRGWGKHLTAAAGPELAPEFFAELERLGADDVGAE
jgi:myo-inositol-1(or 4)-monophosphatase